jgi:hypothetical protein
MMKKFNPKIDHKLFREVVLNKQESLGGNLNVVNTIAEGIKNSSEASFITAFLKLCYDFQISYKCTEEITQTTAPYHITILVNGRDTYTMTYRDKGKDISAELATKLYSELSIQIRNEEFVEEVKKMA